MPERTNIVKPRTFLGFDYGLKRIGVAAGQNLTATTTPLEAVRATDGTPNWEAISRLIETWCPDALIVGIPYHMDGAEHDMTCAARRFGNRLRERYRLPVFLVDERLSSVAAEEMLGAPKKRRAKTGKQTVDTVAAQIILQTWFAEQQASHPEAHDNDPTS
ncbi:MAG: Holliday junction resolvase RuvX [Pseudomonadota bacterium]